MAEVDRWGSDIKRAISQIKRSEEAKGLTPDISAFTEGLVYNWMKRHADDFRELRDYIENDILIDHSNTIRRAIGIVLREMKQADSSVVPPFIIQNGITYVRADRVKVPMVRSK